MNRIQLATLLSWAGEDGLEGRKRLQKIVFFLKHAGCELDCEYILHHYGPYSRDVADTCDEMVAAKLIEEGGPAEGRIQYNYRLSERTRQLLAGAADDQMQAFEGLGKRLIAEDVWPLELGSTILYFYDQDDDWQKAMAKACEYKKADAGNRVSRNALALAQDVHANRPN